MRIVTDSASLQPIGGIEMCTLEDTAALIARGHRVDVFFGADGGQRVPFEASGAALHGPFHFKVRRRSAFGDLRSVLPAMRAIRRIRPDVIWLNRAEHVVWGSVLAAAARVPLVCHLHHAPSSPRTRWLMRAVDRCIAVSAFTRGQWSAAGVPADRIDVLHNAIPAERYPLGGTEELRRARRALGLPVAGRVITFYGRFTDEKGVPTLLAAFQRLARPDTTLLLAGYFPPDHDTGAVRRTLDAMDPATYRIVPMSADVTPFLHAADVVVCASWVEEAFGRAVVEAMSTGRPAIGARSGAVPELLGGGMERLLVPPRDDAALLDAIRGVLDWRDEEPGLGAACRQWVEDRFPYVRHVDRLEALLAAAAR